MSTKLFMPYACVVCGKPGVVQYDNPLSADFAWAAKILCHNRCGEYREKLRVQGVRIVHALNYIERAKAMPEPERAMRVDRGRTVIVNATKIYCFAVCQYYGRIYTWEPFIADGILNAPKEWKSVLDAFENDMRPVGVSVPTSTNEANPF